MNGWAVAEEGDVEDGIARVRVGVRDLRATGAELRLPHYLGILADLYCRLQRLEDAMVTLAEARAVAERPSGSGTLLPARHGDRASPTCPRTSSTRQYKACAASGGGRSTSGSLR
jgi:hypothetical protein